MVFVTRYEYENTKLYALDDRVYKRIERVFAAALGYSVAERIMAKFSGNTLHELSTNSYVDITSAVPVL